MEETQSFPQPHRNFDYWHLHLLVAQGFIGSTNTRSSVQRLCVQTLINQARHLASIAPVAETPTRVVVAISLRDLWASQIIVFFGTEYFDTFFNCHSDTQHWTLLPDSRSLIREWDLGTPKSFSECGYLEQISEPDYNHKGELWFIGQLTIH